jgi:hypothetical protein
MDGLVVALALIRMAPAVVNDEHLRCGLRIWTEVRQRLGVGVEDCTALRAYRLICWRHDKLVGQGRRWVRDVISLEEGLAFSSSSVDLACLLLQL